MRFDHRDGGMASRKFWLVVGSIAGLIAVACFRTPADAVFSTLCGTVSALVALYCGSNTVTKHLTMKHENDTPSKDA